MTIFWGLVALAVGWMILKVGLAFLGTGLGLLFGKYVWDESQNKFVEK